MKVLSKWEGVDIAIAPFPISKVQPVTEAPGIRCRLETLGHQDSAGQRRRRKGTSNSQPHPRTRSLQGAYKSESALVLLFPSLEFRFNPSSQQRFAVPAHTLSHPPPIKPRCPDSSPYSRLRTGGTTPCSKPRGACHKYQAEKDLSDTRQKGRHFLIHLPTTPCTSASFTFSIHRRRLFFLYSPSPWKAQANVIVDIPVNPDELTTLARSEHHQVGAPIGTTRRLPLPRSSQPCVVSPRHY
jgi:hypothetical protein